MATAAAPEDELLELDALLELDELLELEELLEDDELLLDELDEEDELLEEVPLMLPPQPINTRVARDNKRPQRPETRERIM